jgi:hypothetical protein
MYNWHRTSKFTLYQVLGRDTRLVGFGGRGGAVLESPLAEREGGALFPLLGDTPGVEPFAFASNMDATADTDTDLWTSSPFVPALCSFPSFKLEGISIRSKLVEELRASAPGIVSNVFEGMSAGRPPGRTTGHARTVEFEMGVGSMGAARLDR